MEQLQELLQTPFAQGAVVALICVLVAAIILKATKGCIKFLIVLVILAVLLIYVVPLVM